MFVSGVDGELLPEGGHEPVKRMSDKHELVVGVESISRRGRTQRAEAPQVPARQMTVMDPAKVTWVGCRGEFS